MKHDDQGSVRGGANADPERWSVKDAFCELRAGIRRSLPIPEWEDEGGLQWRLLRSIAQSKSLIRVHREEDWVAKFVKNGQIYKFRVGGSEHDCRFVDGHWEKVTKRNGAGWYYDFEMGRAYPAMPLQYLRRLMLFNEILSPEQHLQGIEIGPGEWDNRIWTRQAHAIGEAPPVAYLYDWLETYGFKMDSMVTMGAYDAASFRRGDLWLIDIRPMNFKLGHDGRCYPVDVIVQIENDPELDLGQP